MSLFRMPNTIMQNFRVGMDRDVPEFIEIDSTLGYVLNIGGGKKRIEGTFLLDANMGWLAPHIPFDNESVVGIYAYHFFEHLGKELLLKTLIECERVLIKGGVINLVVPWAKSSMAFQDLDHRTFFTEDTFKELFKN